MRFKSILLVVFLVAAVAGTVRSQSRDLKLIQLRRDFALRYLQPDSHFALAKYYMESGRPVQAFFILEYARRNRFDEPDFDKAFNAYYGDPMPESPAEAKVAFAAASDLVTQQKYDEAETYFQKAYTRYDKSFFINAWIGRFYYKTKSDPSRALPFYFKSYFLYPHAYETEYVESRIRAISIADAEAAFKRFTKDGRSVTDLVQDDNPLLVGMALDEMAKNWKVEYLSAVIEAMDNDDSEVRWMAFAIVHKFAGPSRDRLINEMRSSNDLRKRGLAAYALVEGSNPDKFQILKKMLEEDSELIRFDAVSALVMKGGANGKRILKQHAPLEKQPRLRELIEKALKQPNV